MSFLSDLLGESYKEGMTEEEISSALKGTVISNADHETELNKYKNGLSKANSEVAEWKRKLKEKQTDEENKRQEKDEAFEKLTQENAALKRSIDLAEKKAKLIGMGYDEKMAEETANAMIDGDMSKVMENQSKYLETQKKTIETELLKGTPRPKDNGNGGKGLDLEKLIAEAQQEGNYAKQAYYNRLKAEAEQESE